MNLNRTYFIRFIRIGIAVFILIIILAYALWRSTNYIKGPSISIKEPLDGSIINSTTTTIIGGASRINIITLNGNPISIDESGHFKETILLFTGTNRLQFEGKDQFGRNVLHNITLYRQ